MHRIYFNNIFFIDPIKLVLLLRLRGLIQYNPVKIKYGQLKYINIYESLSNFIEKTKINRIINIIDNSN
jgi:hypothetical protein